MSTSGKQTRTESPLVTRLKQHANMTAIFRSAVPARLVPATTVPPTGQIARAIVLPPHKTTAIGSAVPIPETAQTIVSSVPAATAVSPTPVPTPIVTPVGAEPAPTIQQVSVETAAQPDDKIERRLDTIMRHHREKAANDGSETISGTPSPAQPQAINPPPAVATTDAALPVQRQPDSAATTEPVATPPPAEAERPSTLKEHNEQRLDTIIQRHREKAVSDGSERIPGTPSIQRQSESPSPPAAETLSPQPLPAQAKAKVPEQPMATPPASATPPSPVQTAQATPAKSPQPTAANSTAATDKETSKSVWQIVGRSVRRLTKNIRGDEVEAVQRESVAKADNSPTTPPEPSDMAEEMETTNGLNAPTPVAPSGPGKPPADETTDSLINSEIPVTPMVTRKADETAAPQSLPLAPDSKTQPPFLSEPPAGPELTELAAPTAMTDPPQMTEQLPVMEQEQGLMKSETTVQRSLFQPGEKSTPKAAAPAEQPTHFKAPTHKQSAATAESQVALETHLQANRPAAPAATAVQRTQETSDRMETADFSAAAEANDLRAEQAVPLQAAWPVKRVAKLEAPAIATKRVTAVPIMRQPSPEDEQVQTQISHLSTARPSDSSVAMMRPRRPRPESGPAQVAVTSTPNEPALEGLVTPERPLPTQPPIIQKRSETAAVQTEIGQLPPDLWRLIGQEPPGNQAPDTTADIGSMDSPPAVIQRAETLSYERVSEERERPETAVLQRTEAEPISEIPSTATTETGGEEEKAEEEVDIDKLAREVYSELKHRLSIEWERLRGRYEQNW